MAAFISCKIGSNLAGNFLEIICIVAGMTLADERPQNPHIYSKTWLFSYCKLSQSMTRLILIGLAPMFWFNYFSSDTPDILGSHFLSTRGASYGHEWLVHVDLVTASRCKWCLSHKRTTFTYNVFRLYSSSLLLCQVRDFSNHI